MRIAAFVAALVALGMPFAAMAESAKPAKAPVKTHGKAQAAKPAKPAKPAPESPLTLLAAAANQGEAEAQRKLGEAHRDGALGAKTDIHAALAWFGLAAANGNAAAALDAAAIYADGKGVSRDLGHAARWLYRAAMLGDAPARARWVELILSGEAASLGGETGVAWIAEAANAGDPRAPMILAEAFEKGLGVAANEDAVEGWLRFAALLHGDVEAEYRLGKLLLARPAYWRIPTDEEWNLKEAERKAAPFGAMPYATKPTAAPEEKVSLMRPGMIEGERRLRLAAKRGHAEAQHLLGVILAAGMELPQNMPQAARWLEAAAAQGHSEAMVELAGMAARGDGHFAKDPSRAWALFDLAAANGEDGAVAARDAVAKTMNQRQISRAKQLLQGLRDSQGL